MLELLGAAVLLVCLIQVGLTIFAELRRRRLDEAWGQRRLEAFDRRLEIELTGRAQALEQRNLRWNGYRKLVVDRVVDETDDVRSFYLRPHNDRQLPSFEAGQHLTFKVRIPGRDRPLVRCYSLSDAPREDNSYRVSIKRVPDGLVSNHFHDRISEGMILDVRAPGGSFCLAPADRPIALIAGGVGITPVISMLRELARFGHVPPIYFFYGVRSAVDYAFREEIAELIQRVPEIEVVSCLSKPGSGDLDRCPGGREGWVDREILESVLPGRNVDVYLCGPPPMMDSVLRALDQIGVPGDQVRFEAFGAKTVATSSMAIAKSEVLARHSVRFALCDQEVTWETGSGSLLDLAEANHVAVDSGCRAGSCGTCTIAIRSGSVRYLVEPSTAVEKGSCLACIAEPAEALELEV